MPPSWLLRGVVCYKKHSVIPTPTIYIHLLPYITYVINIYK
jgi:hypothetical protein